MTGLPQTGVICWSTSACCWYTRRVCGIWCHACEDMSIRWRKRQSGGGLAMTFEEILDHALAMLQRRGRVTYRALKFQFSLDDDHLEALKDELLYAHPHVVDDDGRGLLWTGDTAATQAPEPPAPEHAPQPVSQEDHPR